MNVEILYYIGSTFQEDIKNSNILNLLNNLSSQLKGMINQPQQSNYQQNVSDTRNQLIKILHETKINNYPPSWKQILSELGFEGLKGDELCEEIERIFNENKITPSTVLKQISDIYQKFDKLNKALNDMLSSFKVFNIDKEELKSGESEISILIPRKAVHENINNFIRELDEFKKIVSDFNELAIGTRPEIKLKTIASSDYQILLNILPKTAVCIIIGIEIVIRIYKDILDIRKSHKELKEKGVPKKNLAGIENYANNKMADGIAEGVKELIKEFGSHLKPGRKKEMEISLKYSLNKISNRIDNGFNFDVKMKEEKISEDDSDKDSKDNKNQKYFKIIQEKSKELEFLNLSGDKILSLSEKESKKAKQTNENNEK